MWRWKNLLDNNVFCKFCFLSFCTQANKLIDSYGFVYAIHMMRARIFAKVSNSYLALFKSWFNLIHLDFVSIETSGNSSKCFWKFLKNLGISEAQSIGNNSTTLTPVHWPLHKAKPSDVIEMLRTKKNFTRIRGFLFNFNNSHQLNYQLNVELSNQLGLSLVF